MPRLHTPARVDRYSVEFVLARFPDEAPMNREIEVVRGIAPPLVAIDSKLKIKMGQKCIVKSVRQLTA